MKNIIILFVLMLLCFEFASGQTAPETSNDSYTTSISTTLNVNAADGLLQNDNDADGDALSIITFIINGIVYNAGETASIAEGTITINADGSFTFNPTPGFEGNVPLIVYTVSDGDTTSAGNLYVNIPVEGPPIAQDDHDTADIDTPINVSAPGVLSNDILEDQNLISVITFTINGTIYNAGQTANLAQGDFTLFADGSFLFVPAPGYLGNVPDITYTISDGIESSSATLFLTVQDINDLIELQQLSSCNQGYSSDGTYKIRYQFAFRNLSTARDYHSSSMVNSIDLIHDLDAIYGLGCVLLVDDISIVTSGVQDFVNNPYPQNFDNTTVNEDFLNGSSGNFFNDETINNAILYPRQEVSISFCMTIDPFCGGRPNPTPSGSGVDFEAVMDITSSAGNSDVQLNLTDFHTTLAFVTASFDIPENSPLVNPDGTYDFVNSVTLTNEGSAVANNFNFNMGLGSFFDNGLTFNTLTVTQVSGPPVNVNTNYDGDTNTTILTPNNSLAPGDSVVLEIFYLLAPVDDSTNNPFSQVNPSQTQGSLDGFDENTPENRRLFSYVVWEDSLGSHLDRYYPTNISTDPEIVNQCNCAAARMNFSFSATATGEKVITNTNPTPNGILEHQEFTFQISFTNTSEVVAFNNLQLEEDLTGICGNNPLSFTPPQLISSTATTDPILNPNYDGVSDINIFDGTSGFLEPDETITVEISVVLSEDCVGVNNAVFFGTDPLGNIATSTTNVDVDASTDTDDDGISNVNDIDDDNDTILDVDESNGADPLNDDDNDLIPNYRDTDFGPDNNGDGIVDSFDFDGDGVPNHFDLDSDNDGIFDIVEVGNFENDTDSDGFTNNPVGQNGLDDTLETEDTTTATITYMILDTDADGNVNHYDIDADGDGIVDNIEAQPTDNYIPPLNTIDENGLDTAYLTGLNPVDTDGDDIFDYVDVNSDNDNKDDNIEGWDFDGDGVPETLPSGNDADNDGLDDAYDNNSSVVNPTNGQIPTDFPNVDYDVTPERDWRELVAVVVVIDDVSAVEGNELLFTISLVSFIDSSMPVVSQTPIGINLFTTNGTDTAGEYEVAVSPFDYEEVINTNIVIPAQTETFQFSVTSFDDIISELDELFTLNADIISGTTINDQAKGVGTILDNEPLPTISMNDDIVFEGEDLTYIIEMDIPSSSPVEINIFSLDNTATSPGDYNPINITITIDGTTDPESPNLGGGTFNITTLLDNLNEPDEEVLLVLGNVITNNVTNLNLNHTGTILDIDTEPLVVISSDEVVEGNTLMFTISLLNAEGQLTGNFLPIDFEIETLDITTTADWDYPYLNEFNLIPAGESSLTIEIPTINDNLNEVNEFMNLSATIISGTVANTSSLLLGQGTIIDNDTPNLFTPNNDGLSDVFRIANLENYPNFKLIIFDRWGGEVYNYNNNSRISPQWWDGTRNGNPVIEGVYFYELDYNDGVTRPKTGFIQLAR